MSTTVCLAANSLGCPKAGGHLWVYLNWALGLHAVGCRVIWLEGVKANLAAPEARAFVLALKGQLERYGLGECLALFSWTQDPLGREVTEGCLDFKEAVEADLLLNLAYGSPPVKRFRRSALVDIDPGLTQVWMSAYGMKLPPHDLYFTIGETVGQAGALFPDCGLRWHYTPPAVFAPAWPEDKADGSAPFTTVTNWWGPELVFGGKAYYNGKRNGFLPFVDLPLRTCQPLELAICMSEKDADERRSLEERGWRVQNAWEVTPTPWDYQRYIQASRGEFSCVKPSCVHLQNAWISDRTLCYLASGKPAVVEHTGKSRFLPDAAGLFRIKNVDQAARCLETAAADYERHSRLARALAEEYFDARKVVARVLEKALA